MEEGHYQDAIGKVCKRQAMLGLAVLVQDFNLYSKGKEKPLKAFICILERSPSLHDCRGLSVRRQMRHLKDYRWKMVAFGLGGGVAMERSDGFVIRGSVTGWI